MIVINDDTRDSQVQNKKKDTQQDIEIASLQAAVDSINAQITAINSSVSALSDTIDDKYSAQTQSLMSALTNQINALSESLSAMISTNQINADYGNFKTLAVTVSATIKSLAAVVLNVSNKATIKDAEVTNLEAVNETVTSLTATEATLQRAVIDSLSIVGNFSMRALSAESAAIAELGATQISASQKIITPEIYAKIITGTAWQTPIGTPDNTELLKITIPHYEGIIQLITEDREFNVSIFNNSLFTWTEQSGYLFRIQRNDENSEIYLENIGDTVNYQLLFIGSKNIVTATSEIVDKTGIRQNVYTFNGVYGAGGGEGGSGSQIIFVDELPSVGEEGIIYLSKTLGAWVWNDNDGELVPLTGTDLPEAVQTNTENIGNLSDLTTTADSDLVSAINELDSDVGDLTSLTTTAQTDLVSAINEVDDHADTNASNISTIIGNDTGMSMREVAQDVSANVYIPCGSVLFANLPALSGLRVGDVYNIEDDFTTTADFIEGAGHVVKAGSNIVVIDSNNVKKWDVLGLGVDTSSFMTKADPTGTGSFSLNRKANTTVGVNSVAEGINCEASGAYSHAEGGITRASDSGAHAEGDNTVASAFCAHAEGNNSQATAYDAHAEGYSTEARGFCSHTEGWKSKATEQHSHAEGCFTLARSESQHVQGKYNVEDSNGVYADIVGNGTADNHRKNIEATTWTGDKRLKGTVYINCNDDSTGGTDLGAATGASTCLIASSTTVTGNRLATNIIFRIMFTADITGADGSTPLVLNYNGTNYTIKVNKYGSLANMYAHDISGTYKYLQAYTVLELVYDGTNLVVIGNPVVLSSADYTIYADGQNYDGVSKTYVKETIGVRHLQATEYTSSLNGKNRKIELNYNDIGYYNSRTYTLSDQKGNVCVVVVGRNDSGITILGVRPFPNNTEEMLDNIFITTQNNHVTIVVTVHSDNASLMSVDSPLGDLVSISAPFS